MSTLEIVVLSVTGAGFVRQVAHPLTYGLCYRAYLKMKERRLELIEKVWSEEGSGDAMDLLKNEDVYPPEVPAPRRALDGKRRLKSGAEDQSSS